MLMSKTEYKRKLSKIRDELKGFNKDLGKPEISSIVNSRAIRNSDYNQWPDITNLVISVLNKLRVPRYIHRNQFSNIPGKPACQIELYGSRLLPEPEKIGSDNFDPEKVDLMACTIPKKGRWWYVPGEEEELSEYCVMERRSPYPPTREECILKAVKAKPASPKEVGQILERKCIEAYNIEEEKYEELDDLIDEVTGFPLIKMKESRKSRGVKSSKRNYIV